MDKNYLPFKVISRQLKDIIKDHPYGISVEDLLFTYKQKYHKIFDFAEYGFISMKECLAKIPELEYQKINRIEIYKCLQYGNENLQHSNSEQSTETITNFFNDNLENYPESEAYFESGISEDLKEKFKEVLRRNPQGIFSRDFLPSFKAVHKQEFELANVGYLNLIDLVNDLTDVFHKVQPVDCNSDWKIFDAQLVKMKYFDETEKRPLTSLDLENTISVIRRLLLANSEGIYLDEFPHIYAINCELPINVQDLGHNGLINFLYAIKDDVPLTLDYSNIRTKVCLAYDFPLKSLTVKVPTDVVLPGENFTTQMLPNTSSYAYFPIYFANVNSPFDFHIQLKGKETSEKLDNILKELHKNVGNEYVMQPQHIVIGAVCSAIWRSDNFRYRGVIQSVKEAYVEVIFIDYGNVCLCDKHTLRYLKRDHFSLPAQGIHARLGMLKSKSPEFDLKASCMIRSLGEDLDHFMAQLFVSQQNTGGIPSLICYYSSSRTCLNLILIQQGLVELCHELRPEMLTAINPNQNYAPIHHPVLPQFNFGFQPPLPFQPNVFASTPKFERNIGPRDTFGEKVCANEIISKYCQKHICARYVQRIELLGGYLLHIIFLKNTPYVLSGDVFKLFWPYQHNYRKLEWRLKLNSAMVKINIVTKDMYPHLFEQFQLLNIDDICEDNSVNYVILYELTDLIHILNTFGHPSVSIRHEIKQILQKCDSSSNILQPLAISKCLKKLTISDFNKFENRCIFDLEEKLIFYKHKKAELLWNVKHNVFQKDSIVHVKIENLERLYQKCKRRIKDIELLSKNFV